MRRFLLSLLFVGALSAVFSFSAFAATDYVDSPYMGSGQATFNHTASFSVSAEDGDFFYFDVVVNKGYDTILNPSGTNIASQVYNEYFDYSYSVEALGTNYGFGSVQTEGNRVWVFADRPVSSITVTYQVTISYSWRSGTFSGTPVQDLNECIARCPFSVSTGGITKSGSNWPTDMSNSDKLDTANNKLNQILDALGQDPVFGSEYLGTDALIYFNKDYFNNIAVSSGSSASFNNDGFINLSDVTTFSIYGMIDSNRTISYSFPAGSYLISLSYPGSFDENLAISFYGTSASNYDIELLSKSPSGWNSNVVVYKLTVKNTFAASAIYFTFTSSKSGILYGGISKATSDLIAGDAINPDQDGMVSDVDDAGQQQSQQEDEMWQNINTYKGDISFNLDGWDDAAGGLSYVTGVFMTIWNNSPTQPIVLSLMLGIAMLSIGRGVMAAVRVSRNRGDD